MARLFGTDGVRGIANKELTPELAYNLGRAGAYVLTRDKGRGKIIIGKDTRISGDMLESALVAGIMSVGVDVVLLGVVPTPAVAYLTRKYGAQAGVVISASHNPMEYNGIKFFDSRGYKLPDEVEDEIENLINSKMDKFDFPQGKNIGKIINENQGFEDYKSFAISTIRGDLKGYKIVLDCANGACFDVAPKAFEELGAEVITINDKPDGCNINDNCGSTHPEQLAHLVKENKADMGFAYDGDGDRLIAVDNEGQIVDGDHIMLICGLSLSEQGKLKDNTVVVTVMSNLGLMVALKEKGLRTEQTKVGDRYVLERMLENGYSLGGEQSGHIIFLDYNTTGDGLITSVQLASIVKNSGKKLSALSAMMTSYPQVLINARVSNEKKNHYNIDSVIVDRINEVEAEFSGKGRVLIRPSGTEPLVRVMIEGEDQEKITAYAKELAQLIEERMG